MDTLLEEAIEAWEDARNGVIAEVENLPANRFDFRPTPDVRSVTELVIHILEVSLMMAPARFTCSSRSSGSTATRERDWSGFTTGSRRRCITADN